MQWSLASKSSFRVHNSISHRWSLWFPTGSGCARMCLHSPTVCNSCLKLMSKENQTGLANRLAGWLLGRGTTFVPWSSNFCKGTGRPLLLRVGGVRLSGPAPTFVSGERGWVPSLGWVFAICPINNPKRFLKDSFRY